MMDQDGTPQGGGRSVTSKVVAILDAFSPETPAII